MGKQIGFLQTQKDIDDFKNYLDQLGFKFYYRKFIDHKWVLFKTDTLKHGCYYLSLTEFDDSQAMYLDELAIEYSTGGIYSKDKEPDLLSCGRLWIDSSIQGELYDCFEKLRRWMRKNYTHIYDFWFAPDLLKQVKEKKVIATANSGMTQIVDENLNVVLKDTWVMNSRYGDGEIVDYKEFLYHYKDKKNEIIAFVKAETIEEAQKLLSKNYSDTSKCYIHEIDSSKRDNPNYISQLLKTNN